MVGFRIGDPLTVCLAACGETGTVLAGSIPLLPSSVSALGGRKIRHALTIGALVLFGLGSAGWLPAAAAEPIRLALELDGAKISSPLLRVKAVGSLQSLRGLRSHNILKRDFESDDEAVFPSSRSSDDGGCSVAKRSDGRALHYRGGAPYRCLFVIAVQPASHYLIRRRIHTDEPLVDFAVMESRIGLEHAERLNHPRDLERVLNSALVFLAHGSLIYTHHFDKPGRGRWGSDSIHVFTTPHTKSLVIMIQDAEAAESPKARNVWFDDVEVERLEPRPRQELALFKGYGLAPGSDPMLGIAKHAQLLPVSGVIEPPYDVNYEFRHALFAPAPTVIRYPLELPENARLQFSYAMFKASRPGDAVQFRIVVAGAGRETELFRRRIVVRASGEGWHWREASVDLAAFGGQTVELRLETTGLPRARGYALWGNPIIDTRRASNDPPNVLLIGVDTLRADRLSSYGYPRKTSPHIDALAADGVRFERALSNSNWTAPSFASLLTGLTPSQHLVIHRARAIAPEIATLAEYFRDAGWLTHGVAYKPYLYNMGFEQGFDTWLGVPAVASTADAVIAKADEWLRSHGDRRFLLFLHFNDPHQPFNQPSGFVSRYGSSEALEKLGLELPFTTTLSGEVAGCSSCIRNGTSVPSFKVAVSDLYDGEIAYLDDRIGTLIDTLKRRGLYDDTIIAFVSDHGEIIFDRGQFYGHGRRYLFDEAVRVPLIIKPHRSRGPRKADGPEWRRGGVVSQQVRSFDLMPTLLDLAGIEHEPDTMAASTLLPALRTKMIRSQPGQADSRSIEERIAISENLRRSAIAVSWKGWKYVLDHAPGKPVEQSLYRFETDPGELYNVIGRHPAIADPLRAQLIDYFLQYRPGYYLVVTGGGAGPLRFRTHGRVDSVRSLIGAPLVERGPGLFTADASTGGGLMLFAQLDAQSDLRIEQLSTDPTDPTGDASPANQPIHLEEYRAGRVLEMLAETTRTVRAFRTLPSAMAAEQRADDATRREALEALGYIE